MSVYDFNNHIQPTSNGDGRNYNENTNGVQSRYQENNDFRTYSSASMTRPTSQTAMLVRQRRAMMEQLSCYICKGYLIDATTVDECMDSFCRSCIVIYLRNHNDCPKCGTLIHRVHPMSAIRSDKVLQDIVYKLVPGLYDNEMRRRREFYRTRYAISSDEDDEDSSDVSSNERLSHLSGEQYGAITHPKQFYKPTDHIDLSIEPQTKIENQFIYYDNKRQSIVTSFTGNLQGQQIQLGQLFSPVESQQFKTYLRCPAKLTVLQLKKFIATKFNICRDDTIRLFYLNDSLNDEYSLIDVAYIYDWRGIEHMRLYYIIERDLTKAIVHFRIIQPHETSQLGGTMKTRQNVGTSTHPPVKRVCIDPHPKYYEESNTSNNGASLNGTNINGRLMRTRGDTLAAPTKVVTDVQKIPTSSLRSCRANREVATVSSSVANRNSAAVNNQSIRNTSVDIARSVSQESSASRIDTRETRSSPRRSDSESPINPIPKINISLSSLNRSQNSSSDKNGGNFNPKMNLDSQRRNGPVQTNSGSVNNTNDNNNNIRHASAPAKVTSSQAGHQSSLGSLASFMDTRNNHLVGLTGASTTNHSVGVAKFPTNPPNLPQRKADTRSTSQTPKTSSTTPQLAFSFVTERGITIVRRLTSQEEANGRQSIDPSNSTSRATSSSAGHASQTSQELIASSTRQDSQIASTNRSSISGQSAPMNSSLSSNAKQPTSSPSNNEGMSSRHLVKVKPVYKTFVDPTKLKSPNFKKLSYTARH